MTTRAPARTARLVRRVAICVIAAAGVAALSARPLAAQADVIRGRVTAAADNAPILGVVVTATSISGNVSRTARTNSDGRYTIVFPGGDGDYWVSFAGIGFTSRRFEVKRLADESVLIADARLAPITLDTLYVTAGNRRRPGRNDAGGDVSGTEHPVDANLVPADQAGDLAAMGATVPGVTYIPGTNGDPSGFSVLGLSTDQNLTTLNGLASNAADLPRDAGVAVSVATSPYDVAQGGFSGGALNVRTFPGSNYLVQSLSVIGNAPQLEWTDPAGRALGQQYTNLSLGGLLSGPIAYDKAFYNVSYQLGRQSSDLQTLLNTDALGLQTEGVSQDSVGRLLGILGGAGVPVTVPGFPSTRRSDQASLLGSFDFMPPTSASAQALNLTVNGSWNRAAPASALGTQLPTSSFGFTNWNGSARLQHTAYLGFVLSETGLSWSLSQRYLSPYLEQPGGGVLVQSDFADGTSGVQMIQFGGTSLQSTGTSGSLALRNQLSWFSTDNRHRVKLETELRNDTWSQEQASNLLGTFTYNSLADLEAGSPASFTRQLGSLKTSGNELGGALSLGDAFRPSTDLQIVYGLRLDANRFPDRPAVDPDVARIYGVANDHVPNGVYLSPRLGFSWTYGTAPQIGAFMGAARVPRAIVRGGIGVFQNTPSAELPGQAMVNTGLPSGVQQLTCVGAAVPAPDWSAYAADPGAVPSQCAGGSGGGGTVFANGAPNVTLFAPGYAAEKSVRSTLQWAGPVLDNRFMATVTGTWSVNLNQAGSQDLNFSPTVRFTLPDEGNRPVFVQPTSIVPATGAVATLDSRVTTQFNRVTELVSNLRSVSRQLQLQVAPLSLNSTFTWSLAYTLNSVRDQVTGFSSTGGSPIGVDEARSAMDWRHQIQVMLGANLFDLLRVSWIQRFTSGTPYTPVASGDINGDGYANDRAFVFDPARTADTALASGMSRLLAGSSRAVRDCIGAQLGRVAGRNSCEGPWTTTGFLSIAFNPLRVRLPQRATLSLQIANPLGALDLALHGEGHLRGWGQTPTPDPRLLVVEGFDPNARRFVYEVNQRFGSTSQAVSAVRNPVAVTLSLRIDLGPTRERQYLTQTLDRGRTLAGTRPSAGFLRAMYGSAGIINPIATILAQADSLQLTGPQADSLATLNWWYVTHLDSIWTPVIRHYVALPDSYDRAEVYDRYRAAREASVDLLVAVAPAIRSLLTASQRRRLPDLITAYLDPRYLAAVRAGTSGTPGGVFAPGSGVPSMFSGAAVFISR
ncbi:MAG: carboxypeptidase regulatory-like domain-containing protein [Gemmatimonadales bacterium]